MKHLRKEMQVDTLEVVEAQATDDEEQELSEERKTQLHYSTKLTDKERRDMYVSCVIWMPNMCHMTGN